MSVCVCDFVCVFVSVLCECVCVWVCALVCVYVRVTELCATLFFPGVAGKNELGRKLHTRVGRQISRFFVKTRSNKEKKEKIQMRRMNNEKDENSVIYSKVEN